MSTLSEELRAAAQHLPSGRLARAADEIDRLLAQRDAVLALVDSIIEKDNDRNSTHSTQCHLYHHGCLAVAVKHRLSVQQYGGEG